MPSLTGAAILENAAPAASKGSDHPSPSDVFWLIHLKGAHIYSIQSFWHIQIMVVKLGVAMVGIVNYLLGNDNASTFLAMQRPSNTDNRCVSSCLGHV